MTTTSDRQVFRVFPPPAWAAHCESHNTYVVAAPSKPVPPCPRLNDSCRNRWVKVPSTELPDAIGGK